MSTHDYVRDLRTVLGQRPVNWAGAHALILNQQDEMQVLLQKRADTGEWGTPGGITELGESMEDTLRRELQEEAQIKPVVMQLFTIISGEQTYRKLPNGDEFYQITAIYVVPEWSGIPVPDGVQCTQLQFFPLSQLPSELNAIDQQALGMLRGCWSVQGEPQDTE